MRGGGANSVRRARGSLARVGDRAGAGPTERSAGSGAPMRHGATCSASRNACSIRRNACCADQRARCASRSARIARMSTRFAVSAKRRSLPAERRAVTPELCSWPATRMPRSLVPTADSVSRATSPSPCGARLPQTRCAQSRTRRSPKRTPRRSCPIACAVQSTPGPPFARRCRQPPRCAR